MTSTSIWWLRSGGLNLVTNVYDNLSVATIYSLSLGSDYMKFVAIDHVSCTLKMNKE